MRTLLATVCAGHIRIDERAFHAYYSWQVYVAGPDGEARWVTGPR